MVCLTIVGFVKGCYKYADEGKQDRGGGLDLLSHAKGDASQHAWLILGLTSSCRNYLGLGDHMARRGGGVWLAGCIKATEKDGSHAVRPRLVRIVETLL